MEKDIKRLFYKELDEVIQSVPWTEKTIIRGDFNRHIGRVRDGYDTIRGVSVTGRETMKVCLSWTLQLHINYSLLTLTLTKRKEGKYLVTFNF